jgi:hypothetical protein
MKEQDLEVYQTARRVYWTALIIDRFHASSQSTDMMIRRYSGKLSRDDYSALGEVGYHLARKCGINPCYESPTNIHQVLPRSLAE